MPSWSRSWCSWRSWCSPSASPAPRRTTSGSTPSTCDPVGGVANAFLTGDLFNLFVAFEMTLSSYVLLSLVVGPTRSAADDLRGHQPLARCSSCWRWRTYAATGTVNLADLSVAHRRPAERVRSGLAAAHRGVRHQGRHLPALLLAARQLPTAPTPVTAVFAGLLTKVGVYALLRSQTLLFPADTRPGTLLLVVAAPP